MNTVSAYIGTSGRVMFFRFGEGTPADIWTSQASDPTYRVGDGPAIPLVGRTAYAISAGFGPPYVSYPLAEKIEPTDTVTYSAPAGWVSFGASAWHLPRRMRRSRISRASRCSRLPGRTRSSSG
jgi:hypothetical protein